MLSKNFRAALAEFSKVWGLIIAVVVLGFVFTYQFVEPPPPKTLRIATGGKDGAYYAFAQIYARLLAQDDINLEVIPTQGSVENLALLKKDETSLALVQGGSGTEKDGEELQSLGSLFLEPVWVFTQKKTTLTRLSQLQGKKVAVGAVGSGTHLLAMQLLASNGITESNATLIQEGSAQAVRLLSQRKIDAGFFVASPEAPLIRSLLQEPTLELFNFARAPAYTRVFPFLTSVTLNEGVLDLKNNLPKRDTKLVAVAANLVARKDLNSALVPALLKALTEVHRRGGVLEEKNQFPSVDFVDLPLNTDARRYISNGPFFLYQWLHYGTAVYLDRLKIMILPFLALLIPLFRIAPPLYRWRVRSKIYRWYAAVREIDAMVQRGTITGNAESTRKRLKELETEVASITVPLSYTGELYHLRLHIGFVAERFEKLVRQATAPS